MRCVPRRWLESLRPRSQAAWRATIAPKSSQRASIGSSDGLCVRSGAGTAFKQRQRHLLLGFRRDGITSERSTSSACAGIFFGLAPRATISPSMPVWAACRPTSRPMSGAAAIPSRPMSRSTIPVPRGADRAWRCHLRLQPLHQERPSRARSQYRWRPRDCAFATQIAVGRAPARRLCRAAGAQTNRLPKARARG